MSQERRFGPAPKLSPWKFVRSPAGKIKKVCNADASDLVRDAGYSVAAHWEYAQQEGASPERVAVKRGR